MTTWSRLSPWPLIVQSCSSTSLAVANQTNQITENWRIGRFVDEVGAIRSALGLEKIHLFGHSWGGWLAIEYMLSKPPGVVSLILASTSASTSEFVGETENLRSALPTEMQESMLLFEATGDFGNPEYEAALMEFYKRPLCRLDPWPEPLMRSVGNLTDNPVYETMNGPTEFTVIGNLKDWDRTNQLGEIDVPTLITVGRYDEITPRNRSSTCLSIARIWPIWKRLITTWKWCVSSLASIDLQLDMRPLMERVLSRREILGA